MDSLEGQREVRPLKQRKCCQKETISYFIIEIERLQKNFCHEIVTFLSSCLENLQCEISSVIRLRHKMLTRCPEVYLNLCFGL